MNESICEACGFNHQTDSCRDQKALARWRERCAENAEKSALSRRIEERKRREIEAPLRAEIARLREELDRRPEITPEDCVEHFAAARDEMACPASERIVLSLQAHAQKAVKP